MGVEALIVAVYILVRTRLSGVETDSRGYSQQRDKAVTVIRDLRSDAGSPVVIELASVDEWMRETKRGHWLEMDWFENIEPGAGLSVMEAQQKDSDASDDSEINGDESFLASKHRFDAYTAEKPYLQPGLGTMMQGPVDYLSDEKRADYQRWKKSILAQIARIEEASSEKNQAV